MTMRNLFVLFGVTLAGATIFADDLPFWGTENGEGTNLVVTAAAVSSVAKPMAVRTVCVASADPFEFSSYPRGLFISIK